MIYTNYFATWWILCWTKYWLLFFYIDLCILSRIQSSHSKATTKELEYKLRQQKDFSYSEVFQRYMQKCLLSSSKWQNECPQDQNYAMYLVLELPIFTIKPLVFLFKIRHKQHKDNKITLLSTFCPRPWHWKLVGLISSWRCTKRLSVHRFQKSEA